MDLALAVSLKANKDRSVLNGRAVATIHAHSFASLSRTCRFSLIKSKYPHCFHLPDNGGRLTYYERPGLANFADMKKAGITRDHLLQHYMFCMEYLWQVSYPGVKGVSARKFRLSTVAVPFGYAVGLLRSSQPYLGCTNSVAELSCKYYCS